MRMQPLCAARSVCARMLAVPSRVPVATSVRGITDGENDSVNPNFVNRNPRAVELLRVARKPDGWKLEASSPRYWYKLVLERSSKHSTGWVEHHSGATVVSASTQEWAIKRHLYSTSDTCAVHNIGRILARRCLESGITEVYTELQQQAESSTKIQLFLSALKEGGVELQEAPFIPEIQVSMFSKYRPVLPWHVQEEDVVPPPLPPVTSS